MPQITLTTAVAVARALNRVTGVAPGIKWPNDLLLDGKKLGGILTEMETESDRIRHLVVGLGLECRQPGIFRKSWPPLATSLALGLGRPLFPGGHPEGLAGGIRRALRTVFGPGVSGILEEWSSLAVTLGQRVTVRQGPRAIHGLALDVAPDGALLLETDSGEVVRVTSGEIAG